MEKAKSKHTRVFRSTFLSVRKEGAKKRVRVLIIVKYKGLLVFTECLA